MPGTSMMAGKSRQDSASPRSIIFTKHWNFVKRRKRDRTRHRNVHSSEAISQHIEDKSNPVGSLADDAAGRQINAMSNPVQDAQTSLMLEPQAQELVEVYQPPNPDQQFYMPPGSSHDPIDPTSGQVTPLPPAPKSILRKPDQRTSLSSPNHRWWHACYDPESKKVCDRSLCGCLLIILYSILYMIFLAAFTASLLTLALKIIKSEKAYIKNFSKKSDLTPYSADGGVGLSATPTAVHYYPLIWYRLGSEKNYEPYVKAIDAVLGENKRRHAVRAIHDLGPCGKRPYGYGEKPCVIVRINKQLDWSAKPLRKDSPAARKAPSEVRQWITQAQKLWLHCEGEDLWVKEHLSKINYYPNPPGFEPSAFPLNMNSSSPLVGVQFAEFTKGLSLDIKCTLWYDEGSSTIEFTLYVNHDLGRKAKKPRS